MAWMFVSTLHDLSLDRFMKSGNEHLGLNKVPNAACCVIIGPLAIGNGSSGLAMFSSLLVMKC
jgi:hypothetical protein